MLNHLKYLFLLFIFSACSSSEPEIDIVCEIDNTPDYILKWDISPVIEGNVKIYSSVDPQNFDTENGLIAECPISDENMTVLSELVLNSSTLSKISEISAVTKITIKKE